MAAVAAASESELQAAALVPAPTPAAPAAAVDARPLPTLGPRLLMAARRGDSKALKNLLQLKDDDDQPGEGAQPNDERSMEELTLSASAATAPAGSFLVAAVPVLDEDGVTMDGDSLLHVVAACGDTQEFLDCAKMIVVNKEKKGGAGAKRRALEARNNKGDTPLHCAAGAGNAQMISFLAALITTTTDDDNEEARAAVKKAFLRMQNDCGETALHQAIRAAASNKLKFQGFLQLMNMDPELACIPHEDGASPLYLAISLGEFGIARDLYRHSNGKLSYSGPDGRNVLHEVVSFDEVLFKMILEWIKDTKPKQDNSGVSLVSQLTSQRDKMQKGSTPLHLAASLSWGCQTAGLLLDANESTAYLADEEGSYPIHVAAWSGHLSIVKLVLERCPDCATLRDGKGRTFLHVAAEKERCNVVRYGCGEMPHQLSSMILNAQDSNGETSLHSAVRAGNLAVFNCLLGNPRVRLDVQNKDGMTPLNLSQTMLPQGLLFHYIMNSRSIVWISLVLARAPGGTNRPELFTEKHMPKRDVDKESKNHTEATQVMSIVTALIATVTFASAFTLPGGYRSADGGGDAAAAGTPVLAGSYAFDAFILADTLAFICSMAATCTLVYAGLPFLGDIAIRNWYFCVSSILLQGAARSLVAAFGLGLYLVVHHTASSIAACAIVFATSLYGNMEIWRLVRMATTVFRRIGIRRYEVSYLIKQIFLQALAHFWSYVIIFGLPAIRKCFVHQKQL